MDELGISFGNLISLISILLLNVGIIYKSWTSTIVKLAEYRNENEAMRKFYDQEFMYIKERLQREQTRNEKSFECLQKDISKLFDKLDEVKDLIINNK